MKNLLLNAAILFMGLGMMGMAIFAQALGIDNNSAWGTSRIVLLTVGVCVVVFAGIPKEKAMLWLDGHLEKLRGQNGQSPLLFSNSLKDHLFVLPAICIVVTIYVWFASLGTWTTWYPRTEYFSLLARGFQKHQLYLPVAPSEKLLALPNPYDPGQRIGVGEPMDFSLYEGKFYLYWGPVPALILVIFNLFLESPLPDVVLVFGFSCGLFLVEATLLIFIWRRLFSNLPKWILIMAVLLAGLAGPYPWMIGLGSVYEVAITGGQFFLMSGFLSILLTTLRPSASNVRIILTGVLWALAIGTRLTLILPVGFMVLMCAYVFWKDNPARLSGLFRKTLLLGSPILLGMALLAWYNWARFGSLSETGFAYSLAGTNLQEHLDEVVSHRYIIPNLYNYFLAPFAFDEQFPFLRSGHGSIEALFSFYHLPGFYNTNPITGLIFVFPFFVFSFIPLINFVRSKTETNTRQPGDFKYRWMMGVLYGSVFLTLLLLLMFFWGAMRYVADFLPMVMLASMIGFYRIYAYTVKTDLNKYVVFVGISLATISITVSILLGLAETVLSLLETNPAALTTLLK